MDSDLSSNNILGLHAPDSPRFLPGSFDQLVVELGVLVDIVLSSNTLPVSLNLFTAGIKFRPSGIAFEGKLIPRTGDIAVNTGYLGVVYCRRSVGLDRSAN